MHNSFFGLFFSKQYSMITIFSGKFSSGSWIQPTHLQFGHTTFFSQSIARNYATNYYYVDIHAHLLLLADTCRCSGMCAFYCLQVIKNPISDHLPTGCLKIGTSFHADQLVDVRTFAKDKPIVFVVGAMAHGKASSLWCSGTGTTIYCYCCWSSQT